MATSRRLYLFDGRVQGVGFRMTAQRLARAFPISGYVKNLPDGRVEVLVDGDGSQIARFLGALRSEFDGYIERLTEEPAPVDAPHLESFEIRY